MADIVIFSRTEPKGEDKSRIYDKLVEKFGVSFDQGTIFTIGNVIYHKKDLTDDLEVHERTHVSQQLSYPGGKWAWWDKYLEDPGFRLSQELEAYRRQCRYARSNYKNREKVNLVIQNSAMALSGKMYGELVDFNKAIDLIIGK